MKAIETERLILRKFTPDDFEAVHSYASSAENTKYIMWGPNTVEQTIAFINKAIKKAEEKPCTSFKYAAILKSSGKLIGSCFLRIDGYAEIGWILHRDYWKRGYGTEMGRALLNFGFGELNLHRIIAHCDAENSSSYSVMEKIGMRREGLFIEGRPSYKGSETKYSDEMSYAILKREWRENNEIN